MRSGERPYEVLTGLAINGPQKADQGHNKELCSPLYTRAVPTCEVPHPGNTHSVHGPSGMWAAIERLHTCPVETEVEFFFVFFG